MEEKNLSGEEKRAKLKEEYKQEMLLRKRMLEQMQARQKTSAVDQAMNHLEGLGSTDDSDVWIEKLNRGAALADAKIDMTLGLTEPNITVPADLAAEAGVQTDTKTLGDMETGHPKPTVAQPPVDTKTLGDEAK